MKRKQLFTFIVLLMLANPMAIMAQMISGIVVQKGSNTRISNAGIFNKITKANALTNNLGLFSIGASFGDTLLINHPDFLEQVIVVTDFKDIIVHLQRSNILNEVVIKRESTQQRLAEAEKSFRQKGIYYKGRPPLTLLSPFGGSPLTFFHELLSRDGRNARRFSRFAQSEGDYHEVASRFNDYNIKKVIPINDEELPDFKKAFWPSVEQIRTWKEFDLYNYIKKAYSKFLTDRVAKDGLVK